MSAPTIRELCERANGFPTTPGSGTALAEMERRLSPDVVMKVVEALEEAEPWLTELHNDGDAADWAIEKHHDIACKLREALSVLNHPHAQPGEKK